MINRNAIAGRNVETLFCNSIGDNNCSIQAIREIFGIEGVYLSAIRTGIHGEKCDVKISFACGHNIDANIKAYKPQVMLNQTTRMSLTRFQKIFGLQDIQMEELSDLFFKKAHNTNRPLIPCSLRNKWREVLESLSKKIVKWSLSKHPSREILVLYDRTESIMRIYKMNDILNGLDYGVSYTPRGNFKIGCCFQVQRKGGDGNVTRYKKTDLRHPSNDIQVKLDIRSFLKKFEPFTQYDI